MIMNDELEINGLGLIEVESWCLTVGTAVNYDKSRDSPCPFRDSNRAPPVYEPKM
jgi:hypothetical protein